MQRKGLSGTLPERGPRKELEPPDKRRLRKLVEDAIVDAYMESEQCTGLFTMIESHLALPFETELLPVT